MTVYGKISTRRKAKKRKWLGRRQTDFADKQPQSTNSTKQFSIVWFGLFYFFLLRREDSLQSNTCLDFGASNWPFSHLSNATNFYSALPRHSKQQQKRNKSEKSGWERKSDKKSNTTVKRATAAFLLTLRQKSHPNKKKKKVVQIKIRTINFVHFVDVLLFMAALYNILRFSRHFHCPTQSVEASAYSCVFRFIVALIWTTIILYQHA